MKFITYLFLLLPFATISQNITYSGVVKDNVTHQPIEHVSISVYNSNISTLTNSEGRFRIMVPTEFNKLNFSHINYDAHDVVVSSSQEEIQVYLSDTSYELEEMIIYDRPIKDIMKEVIDNSKAKFAKDIKLLGFSILNPLASISKMISNTESKYSSFFLTFLACSLSFNRLLISLNFSRIAFLPLTIVSISKASNLIDKYEA